VRLFVWEVGSPEIDSRHCVRVERVVGGCGAECPRREERSYEELAGGGSYECFIAMPTKYHKRFRAPSHNIEDREARYCASDEKGKEMMSMTVEDGAIRVK
jgi:hypothetical protein